MSRRRNKSNRQQYGRDVAAPERYVRFNGQRYKLEFSNRALRIMEDVYADCYGKPELGVYDILTEIGIPKHRALMAAVYASILAGGGQVSWEDFDEQFTLDDIEGLAEIVQGAILQSLPESDGDTDGEPEKNAEAAPATSPQGSRGRG